MKKNTLFSSSALAEISLIGLLVVPALSAKAGGRFGVGVSVGVPIGVGVGVATAPVVVVPPPAPAGYYTTERRLVIVGYGPHREPVYREQLIQVFHPAPVVVVPPPPPPPLLGIGAHIGAHVGPIGFDLGL